jgi:hypothetical protein
MKVLPEVENILTADQLRAQTRTVAVAIHIIIISVFERLLF